MCTITLEVVWPLVCNYKERAFAPSSLLFFISYKVTILRSLSSLFRSISENSFNPITIHDTNIPYETRFFKVLSRSNN
jgi:hypothetical protein